MPPRLSMSPNTHNPVAQASAAKLIQLLHENYPEIKQFPDEANPDNPENQAQASLLHYLERIISKSVLDERDLEAIKANPNIRGTVQWIDYVNALKTEILSDEDKKRIFQQMQVIARIYQGGDWTDNQEQWSINQLYVKETKTIVTIMTPPALALNLVCTALFDSTRFVQDEKQPDGGLLLRIESTYLHLLDLKKQVESGQLQKCAAGLQHDLLFFLNESYLDKSRENGGRPIEMPMELASFMQTSLTGFLNSKIHQNDNHATHAMIFNWIDWEITKINAENPMIVWLRTLYPTKDSDTDIDLGWKNSCRQYLSERCEDFGLNPNTCHIDDYVDSMESIPAVLPNHVFRYVAEIKRMDEVLPLPSPTFRSDNPNVLFKLILLRNQVFCQFKEGLVNSNLDALEQRTESIMNLLSALNVVNKLYRYRNLTLLVGDEDRLFQEARTRTEQSLLEYFYNYTPTLTSPCNISEICDDYLKAECIFF